MGYFVALLSALLLAACAGGSGGLKPDEARLEDVLRVMGQPAMRRQATDGSSQLVYPRGPMGTQTYMVRIGADGRMQGIENVLNMKTFARIRAGMTRNQVLDILGPPEPSWTVYFKARDELAWEWRYCDDWNQAARFNVLFDASTGEVRSTLSLTEAQRGFCRKDAECICAH